MRSSVAASDLNDPAQAVSWLRSTEAVRTRCHALLELGQRDALANFSVHLERLPEAARYVAAVMRENYPSLEIPYHARGRHFCAGGIDRWAELAGALAGADVDDIARIRFELCVVSVLLDGGAGSDWTYAESESGQTFARSEGLAVASLHAFRAGLFSGDKTQPLRADAEGLGSITRLAIEVAFQVGEANPLVGVAGRECLMRELGAALRARPDLFGWEARVGGLYTWLMHRATQGTLSVRTILGAILDGFGAIWPSGTAVGGVNLGDVWRHPAVASADLTSGLVPFHKLSQWLTYSLIEVFEDAGVRVTELDSLTGLPEYRNGGLFLDLGVLSLRPGVEATRPLPVHSEIVVEWRALTLALLDAIAGPVRDCLGKSQDEMPLARILEGGTWSAGRKIAREKRRDGGSPIPVASDGTVF